MRLVGLGVALTAGPALLASPAPAADPCRPADAPVVAVAEVTAGDTLRLADGRIVRLAGLMAPRSLESPMPAVAEAARAALAGLVEAAGTVRFAAGEGPPDRYGRLHGRVFVTDADGGETWASERLLAAGHAILVAPDAVPACAARLTTAEAAARRVRAGLWSDPRFAVVNAADPSLGQRTGVYVVVEGRVASVGTRSYMTFLDFGADYRRDFTAMLTPKLVDTLAETGVIARNLAGRRVEVRGVVEESGGPAIRLRRAGDLRVLDE